MGRCGTEFMTFVASNTLYLAPLLPAAARLCLVYRHRQFMQEALSAAEQQQEEHRTVILALAGFAFTGALALPAYGVSANVDVLLPTFYVVLSFLCYVGALNAQAYKYARWHDQLASGLADVASFCLLGATVGMVMLLRPSTLYLVTICSVALAVWLVDLVARMRAWRSYFDSRVATMGQGEGDVKAAVGGQRVELRKMP